MNSVEPTKLTLTICGIASSSNPNLGRPTFSSFLWYVEPFMEGTHEIETSSGNILTLSFGQAFFMYGNIRLFALNVVLCLIYYFLHDCTNVLLTCLHKLCNLCR